MTLKELDLKPLVGISDFGKIDETTLDPGWYVYPGSGGCIVLEKRGDGTLRHAMIGSGEPMVHPNKDIEYYFREGHWFN